MPTSRAHRAFLGLPSDYFLDTDHVDQAVADIVENPVVAGLAAGVR